MKGKKTTPEIAEIKKLLETDKLIIGTQETLKKLKQTKIQQVFIASNTSEQIKKDLNKYTQLGNTKLTQLTVSNRELGTICKKPFAISVLGLKKE